MVKLNSIDINNFVSIKHIKLKNNEGMIRVLGENKDNQEDGVASNGAGKTSVLTALHQGLFNKTLRNPKAVLGDVNNAVTGEPYIITVDLNVNAKHYKIVNDRARGTIDIIEDGKNISPKGIKAQLAKIEQLLGLDYELFSTLTFVSQVTLYSIIDTSSTENLVYKFIDVDTINYYEKALKSRQSEYSSRIAAATTGKISLEKSLAILKNHTEIDFSKLYAHKTVISDSILDLQKSTVATKLKEYKVIKDKLLLDTQEARLKQVEASTVVKSTQATLNSLKSGTCPTCGTSVTSTAKHLEESLKEQEQILEHTSNAFKELQDKKLELDSKILKAETAYNEKENALQEQLRKINNQILISEENQKNMAKILANVEEVKKQLQAYDDEINEYQENLAFIKSALTVIKSGAVTKQYIQSFVSILNVNLLKYCQYLDIPVIINAVESKGRAEFVFKNSGVSQLYENFSSGERTRIALIVLFSVIDTLEQLTGVSVNYLVLDELLSVLDKQGVDVLKKLLVSFVSTKAVYVVLHHDEIESTFFTDVVKIYKKNGVTNLE